MKKAKQPTKVIRDKTLQQPYRPRSTGKVFTVRLFRECFNS